MVLLTHLKFIIINHILMQIIENLFVGLKNIEEEKNNLKDTIISILDFYDEVYKNINQTLNNFLKYSKYSYNQSKLYIIEEFLNQISLIKENIIFDKIEENKKNIFELIDEYEILYKDYNSFYNIFHDKLDEFNLTKELLSKNFEKINKIRQEINYSQTGSDLNNSIKNKLNDLISKIQMEKDLFKYKLKNYNNFIIKSKDEYIYMKNRLDILINKKNEILTGIDLNFSAFCIDFGNIFISLGEKINNIYKKNNDKLKITSSSILNQLEFPIEVINEENFNLFLSSKTSKFELQRNSIKRNLSLPINLFQKYNIFESFIPKDDFFSFKRNNNEEKKSLIIFDNEISKDLICNLINSMLDVQEMTENEIDISFEILSSHNNERYFELFIKEIIDKMSYSFLCLKNYNNLLHISNFINLFFINKTSTSSIIKLILMKLSQIIYYDDQDNYIFLSFIISKNEYYSNKNLWLELFELEYYSVLKYTLLKNYNNLINILYEEIGENINSEELFSTKIKDFLFLNPKNKEDIFFKKNLTFFFNIKEKYENLFENSNFSLKSNLNILIDDLNFKYNIFDIYSLEDIKLIEENISYLFNFPTEKVQKLLIEIFFDTGLKIIRKYVFLLTNFNIDSSISIEFLFDISSKLGFQKEYIKLFVSYFKTNSFSIISNKEIKFNSKKEIQKKNSSFNTFIDIFQENISKYLKKKEIIILREINKELLNFLNEFIFSNEIKLILINDSNLIFHKKIFKIWCIILNVNKYQKEYRNYSQNIYNFLKSNENDLKSQVIRNNLNMINLDVIRTNFIENNIEYRQNLLNIFIGMIIMNNEFNYCQGMNMVVNFIFSFTNFNEEDSFSFYYSLLNNSNYNFSFHKDLYELKKLFYIFERVLYLFLPNISQILNKNKINASYYCSKWFSTIFTNNFYTNDFTFSFIVIRIWNEFLLNGWVSLIKTLFIFFFMSKEKIMMLSNDQIYEFIFNIMIKNILSNNENYIEFSNIWDKIQFPRDLYESLEVEYSIIHKLDEEII